MKTLIGKVVGELHEKRFYFKGKIKVKCPNCKATMQQNFEEDYLSYPSIGEEDTIGFCCDKCEKDWEMPLTVKSIDIVIDYDDERITEQ
jgi:endogenous inhibitor of DNA gyrase (YacG/DUF329 family)